MAKGSSPRSQKVKAKLKSLEQGLNKQLPEIKNAEELEKLRIEYLGRKGLVTEVLKNIAKLPKKDRPAIGQLLNNVKGRLVAEIQQKFKALSEAEKEMQAKFDVTLPGIEAPLGKIHPVTVVTQEICRIFQRLGFQVVEGPEIETDYYNFGALNIPPEHPSRETFHTFYLENGQLLRSQTSTVQIRIMEKRKPPLQIIAPGKVFRPDATDASHSFMFHQLEGLMVDKGVSFADLKGVLTLFARQMFGENVKMRFRPHFFPFTEPSAEVDISCIICGGRGCRLCSSKGWLEILGAGMVHPNVFRAVKYDPEEYSGFAFGMGIERIAMLKYQIPDIRLFFENDLRFLQQF